MIFAPPGRNLMTTQQKQFFGEETDLRPTKAEVAPVAPRPQHTLQDYLPQESLLAVKVAQHATSLEMLREQLTTSLPQNSGETRHRYVESLMRWFFRDGLDGLATQVWRRYQNTELQSAIHRYLYLTAEPIMGTCVSVVLARLADGILVPGEYLGTNTAKVLQHEVSPRTQQRLLANLRKLGLLERGTNGDRVITPPINKTALLLALHHAFAVDAPRTIEFSTLAENPFWRYIGLRSEDTMRDFLKEAEHGGWLGKYVVADRLEQVTTCHTLTELLEKGVSL